MSVLRVIGPLVVIGRGRYDRRSGGFRGGSGGSLEPPLGPNYFNFMGKFMKNQAKC